MPNLACVNPTAVLRIQKITIIGVGLIGGSFALGLKKAGLVSEVVGFGLNEANLKKAVSLNVIDRFSLSLEEAVKDTDLIFLAVPLGAMQSVLTQLKPFLTERVIITDAGSSKMSVVNAVKSALGYLPSHFVAGHPIAGKESSGVEAADGTLYQDHRVLLTPTKETNLTALATVRGLWESVGANVTEMTPEHHDHVLAATSHLPHLLAFGLVDLLDENESLGNVFQYTAGGFKDFTRIASSDATMWRDIALNNKDAIVTWLGHYQEQISHLTELIETEKGDELHTLFSGAKSARDSHYASLQAPQK